MVLERLHVLVILFRVLRSVIENPEYAERKKEAKKRLKAANDKVTVKSTLVSINSSYGKHLDSF